MYLCDTETNPKYTSEIYRRRGSLPDACMAYSLRDLDLWQARSAHGNFKSVGSIQNGKQC